MAVAGDLWRLEQRFWLDGPDFYHQRMHADAIMVFAEPVGVLKGEDILKALEGAPRWKTVDMTDHAETRLGGAMVLAYRAIAVREESEPYVALCSSTYVHDGHAWKLLAHQQTPMAD